MTVGTIQESIVADSGEMGLLEKYVQTLAARLRLLLPELPFLRRAGVAADDGSVREPQMLGEEAARLTRDLESTLEATVNASHPLVLLAQRFALSSFELDLLMLAVLPEFDERFGDVYQDELSRTGRRRLTVGEALPVLVSSELDRGMVRARLERSALWSAGLLRLMDPRRAVLERDLEATAVLSCGLDGRLPPAIDSGDPLELIDPTAGLQTKISRNGDNAAKHASERVARWLRSVGAGLVHLPARSRDDAWNLAGLVTEQLGVPLLRIRHRGADVGDALRQVSVSALLTGALAGLELDQEHESVELPPGWAPPHPVLLVTSHRAVVSAPAAVAFRRVLPPSKHPLEQAAIWSHLLGQVGGDAAVDILANQTHLNFEQIESAVAIARDTAASEGRDAPTHADVVGALEDVVPCPRSPLALTDRPRVPWSRLVLPRKVKARLETFVRRVHHRLTVHYRWEMQGVGGRGNSPVALLHGESGVGKTLAAQAVATQVCLPMMTLDISRILSKYLGESEKRLDEVISLAEGYRALLFIDEADSLLGTRTQIRDAHDRWANAGVNFILQRLEVFDGIAVLATNMLQNTDEALTRRIPFIVHLPRPTPGQQLAIWQKHLPAERLDRDVDLQSIVSRYDLVGGDIRNASLAAAFSAAARQSAITQSLLEHAIRHEYEKRGRPVPAVRRRDHG